MDEIEQVLGLYISESRELLDEMELLLLNLENEQDKAESLNAIFRAAHTIKGRLGFFRSMKLFTSLMVLKVYLIKCVMVKLYQTLNSPLYC